MQAAAGNVSRVITKVQKSIKRTIRYEEYVTASTAIATGRPTSRNELFTSEGSYSIPTISPLKVNL